MWGPQKVQKKFGPRKLIENLYITIFMSHVNVMDTTFVFIICWQRQTDRNITFIINDFSSHHTDKEYGLFMYLFIFICYKKYKLLNKEV